MLTYALQVAICWAFFIGIYHLMLRKETFFMVNRTYLLVTIVLGLLIPQVTWDASMWMEAPAVETTVMMLSSGFDQMVTAIAPTPVDIVESKTPTWVIIYRFGVAIMLLKLLWGIINILRLHRSARKTMVNGQQIAYTTRDHAPFTFFGIICFSESRNDEDKDLAILIHESAHVSGWHTLDVLFIEVMKAIFWFNPLIYIYDSALKTVHEHIADAQVLRQTALQKYGRLLLRQAQPGLEIALANHFYHHQLKKRFKMMTRTPSQKRMLFKYLSVLPFILLISLVFTNQKVQAGIAEVEEIDLSEVILSTGAQEEFNFIADSTKIRFGEINSLDTLILYDQFTIETHLVETNEIYSNVDQMPEYPGGNSALQQFIVDNLKIPTSTIEDGFEGRVFVDFIIDREGSMTYINASEASNQAAKLEAFRVIQSMSKTIRWTPGIHKDNVVRVEMSIPISFSSNGAQDISRPEEVIETISRGDTVMDAKGHMIRIDTITTYYPERFEETISISRNELALPKTEHNTEEILPKTFDPSQGPLKLLKEGNFKIQIRNKFGNLIFDSENYQNDWDGKWNGGLLKPQTLMVLLTDANQNKILAYLEYINNAKRGIGTSFEETISNAPTLDNKTGRITDKNGRQRNAIEYNPYRDQLKLYHTAEYELSIYTTSGQRIYQNKSYRNDWDGKVEGKMLSTQLLYMSAALNGKTREGRWMKYINEKPNTQGSSSKSSTNQKDPEDRYLPGTYDPSKGPLKINQEGEYYLEIMNRWGNLVLKQNNYKNDWKGTRHGKTIPSDTYAYRLWNSKRRGAVESGTIKIIIGNGQKVNNLTKVINPTHIIIVNVAREVVYRNKRFTNNQEEYAKIMQLPDGNYSYTSSDQRGIGGWFSKKGSQTSWKIAYEKVTNAGEKAWPISILLDPDGRVVSSITSYYLDVMGDFSKKAFLESDKNHPYPESKVASTYNINNEISDVEFIDTDLSKYGNNIKSPFYAIKLRKNPSLIFSDIADKEKIEFFGDETFYILNTIPRFSIFNYSHNYATTEKTALYIHTLDGTLVDKALLEPRKTKDGGYYTGTNLKTKKWPKGILMVTSVIGGRYMQSAIINEEKRR